MTSNTSIPRLIAGLFREIRRASTEKAPKIANAPQTSYIRAQLERFRVTSRQHCRAEEEMRYLADAYATYLRSQRQWLKVHEEFHAKGERSVAETARLVGFKLPHDPK